MIVPDDKSFMKKALDEAREAEREGEVPVGAVVVLNGKIIGKGHNQVERMNDVTAHAEMIALSAAVEATGSKYLEECTLYVTLEPCAMCAAALQWARLNRLVYGADDPKYGFRVYSKRLLHPKTAVSNGILAEKSRQMMQKFFREKRK